MGKHTAKSDKEVAPDTDDPNRKVSPQVAKEAEGDLIVSLDRVNTAHGGTLKKLAQ